MGSLQILEEIPAYMTSTSARMMEEILKNSLIKTYRKAVEARSPEEKKRLCERTADRFIEAGEDKVVYTMEDLRDFLPG